MNKLIAFFGLAAGSWLLFSSFKADKKVNTPVINENSNSTNDKTYSPDCVNLPTYKDVESCSNNTNSKPLVVKPPLLSNDAAYTTFAYADWGRIHLIIFVDPVSVKLNYNVTPTFVKTIERTFYAYSVTHKKYISNVGIETFTIDPITWFKPGITDLKPLYDAKKIRTVNYDPNFAFGDGLKMPPEAWTEFPAFYYYNDAWKLKKPASWQTYHTNMILPNNVPITLFAVYQEKGYNILCITDHGVIKTYASSSGSFWDSFLSIFN